MKVTVLEHIDIPYHKRTRMIFYQSLTKVLVEKYYVNRLESDTLFYKNNKDGGSISSLKPNSQYILVANRSLAEPLENSKYLNDDTGQIERDTVNMIFWNSYEDEKLIDDNKSYRINNLEVLDDLVIGPTTKNYYKRYFILRKPMLLLMSIISKRCYNKMQEKFYTQEIKQQKLTEEEFTRKLNRKFASLN